MGKFLETADNVLDMLSFNKRAPQRVISAATILQNLIRLLALYKTVISLSSDVDECKEISFICGLDGICINKNGSYDCVCPEGQSPNPNDNRCEGKCIKQTKLKTICGLLLAREKSADKITWCFFFLHPYWTLENMHVSCEQQTITQTSRCLRAFHSTGKGKSKVRWNENFAKKGFRNSGFFICCGTEIECFPA